MELANKNRLTFWQKTRLPVEVPLLLLTRLVFVNSLFEDVVAGGPNIWDCNKLSGRCEQLC